MTLDEVIAREAIRHTLSVYTNAGDRGALEELASAFLPDGVLEMFGGTFVGRAAIIERLAHVVDPTASGPGAVPLGFLRHHLTSCRIDLAGAEASVWTYFVVNTPIGLDHSGVYVDRFARVGDDWLIARRRIKVDWAHERSRVVDPSLARFSNQE